ncbi:hypothetical protein O1611_g3683 [Lasiodiplodia mahajangana]|uniref:Uncharacterized protein n=1 Tax=Lasiodiplodia mahajangana TaxID=1108764 RepID=A0ACC2JR19_9PEZI|nr:hypothetical protein O1611_g3683 [Lasiodiplodia mahajangana]
MSVDNNVSPGSQSAAQYRDDDDRFPTRYRVRFRFAKLSDANQLKNSPESWRPNNYIKNIVASEIADNVLYIYTNCPTAYSLLLHNQGASAQKSGKSGNEGPCGEHCARTCNRDPRCIHCGEDHAAWQCDSEAAPPDVIAMREVAKRYQGMKPQWYQFHLDCRAISSITPPSLPLANTKKGTNTNKQPTGPVKTGPTREDTTQLTIVEMFHGQTQCNLFPKPPTPVRNDTPVPSGLTSEAFNPVLLSGPPSVMGQSKETAALGNTDVPMAADQLACSADQTSSTIGVTSREPSQLASSTERVAQKHSLPSVDHESDATVDKLKKPAAKKRRTEKTEGCSAESMPAKKRGRGRPPGSKNKTKLKDTPCTQLPFTPRPTPGNSSPSSAPLSSSCLESVHAATLLPDLTLSLSPPQEPTRSGLVLALARVDKSTEPSCIVQEPTIKCHALISKEAVSPRAMPAIVKGHDEPQGPQSPVAPLNPLGFNTCKILRKQTGTIH